MNAHVNFFRRQEEYRFHHYRHQYRPSFFGYSGNSVFGQGYGNYGYQPYEQPHNNFFGKLLGFGAVAALGYGIGKSGGIVPFFNKIGGFFNKIFGHKEERRDDLSGLKRLESMPARVENREAPKPGLIGMDKLQETVNKTSTDRTIQNKQEPAEEKKSEANTYLPTDKGYQLPEVVITAKRINKVESLPTPQIETKPTTLNVDKLAASIPQQTPVQQPPAAQPVKTEQPAATQQPANKINPHDKHINPLEAINGVSEKDNGLLTAEQLSKMTPEQQEQYKKDIKNAILK